jgi:hypothetical protein
MIIAPMLGRDRAGRKKLYSCTTSTGSAYRPCAIVEDVVQPSGKSIFTVLLVNDGVVSATSGGPKGQPFTTAINLAPFATAMALQSGTVGAFACVVRACSPSLCALSCCVAAVVNELSTNGYYGEVSSLPVVSAATGWTITLAEATWSVLSITLPTGAQTQSLLRPTDDASVFAGARAGTNFGAAATLTVGTSVSANHDTTSVAFIRFDTASLGPTVSSAILELTVAQVDPSGTSLLTLIALNAGAVAGLAEGTLTWNAASWALNASVDGVVDNVVRNFVKLDAHAIAGHISVNPGDTGVVKRVDVTDSVLAGGAVGFLIARRMRNNFYGGNFAPAEGIPADTLNGGAAVAFFSKETGLVGTLDKRPALRMIVNGNAAAVRLSPAEEANLRDHAAAEAEASSDDDDEVFEGDYSLKTIAELHTATGESGQCSSWESPYINHFVSIQGTVIAVFDGSGDVDGFVVQDSTAAFSGMLVLLAPEQVGSLTAGLGFMPDTRSVVRVEGVVGHVLGNPVLQRLSAVTLVTRRVAMPDPVHIMTRTLYAGCTLEGEMYRNMVIELTNVQFTIDPDPSEMSAAQYRTALGNLSNIVNAPEHDPSDEGELYLDDGTGPVQIDDKLFDVIGALGWDPQHRCGVYLGTVIESVTAVAVFDDSQSAVGYELGNPPTLELNIIEMSTSRITACPDAAPAAPAPVVGPPAHPPTLAQLTISGINAAAFDLAVVQLALVAMLGASATVESAEYPVEHAQFSFMADDSAAALQPATLVAVARSLAVNEVPIMASNIALAAVRAGGRRSLQMARAAYTLSVFGLRTPGSAAKAVAGISAFATVDATHGLAVQLLLADETDIHTVSVDALPVVSARLGVSVTYARADTASPQATLDATLSVSALAAALTAAGVANTGVSAGPAGAADDDEALTPMQRKLVGGIVGGVGGALLLCCVALLVARSLKSSAAAMATPPPPSKQVDEQEPSDDFAPLPPHAPTPAMAAPSPRSPTRAETLAAVASPVAAERPAPVVRAPDPQAEEEEAAAEEEQQQA